MSVLRDDKGKKNGMTAGRQDKFKGAGDDPYNKAGKADGRGAEGGLKGEKFGQEPHRSDVAAK